MEFLVDHIVPGIVWMFVVVAMVVGMAFILSKTLPCMPNKASRFALLFVLWVPVGFLYDYSNILRDGYYHRMSWTGALICAALWVTLGTFLFSPSLNSN